jgi:glycosyltransferase involved in cell wall biosynthesis
MNQIVLSVVVSTYNRAVILKICLESLEKQGLSKDLYEVIIVDNNSSDATAEVSQAFVSRNSNFRYVLETNQGLSYSRNRGWKEAKGTYIAYIDDDGRAYPDWLENMYDFIQRMPEIKVFGGPYDAFALVEIPNWYPPEYGTLDRGPDEIALDFSRGGITGTNMVFHRSLFIEHGGFNTDLGMKGETEAYGEETEYISKLYKQGITVYYVPQMKVSHLVADYKLSVFYILKSIYKSHRDSFKKNFQEPSLCYLLWRVVESIFVCIYLLFKKRNLPFKRALCYSFAGLAGSLGDLAGYMKKKFK